MGNIRKARNLEEMKIFGVYGAFACCRIWLRVWLRFCVLVGVFALCGIAWSEELLIDARRVFADEKRGITSAEGSVHITKERDKLNADKVNVYMSKERKPFKFEAIGNVDFHIFTEDGRELKGKSDTLIYLIEQSEYQLIGRAEAREIGKPNYLKGERIIFNNKENFANVQSEGDAPVRVIIDLNDIQQKK